MAVKEKTVKKSRKGLGGRKTRNLGELDSRRRQVAHLYCTGRTMWELAEIFNVSAVTIHNDMKAVRAQWQEETKQETAAWAYQQIIKIDKIESAAWEGWDRSVGDHSKTTIETFSGGRGDSQKHVVVDEPIAGDPRFLAVVLNCVQRRCAMLGLDAPEKIEDVTPRQPVEILVETKQETMSVRELLDASKSNTESN